MRLSRKNTLIEHRAIVSGFDMIVSQLGGFFAAKKGTPSDDFDEKIKSLKLNLLQFFFQQRESSFKNVIK